jgi:predicted Zn-dependent peptidase
MRHYLLSLLCFPVLLCAQDLKEFEKNVTEFDLPNGMHFIVLERHQAPVVSFYAQVNSGSTDDPAGKSGLAHMFEHMIGKGTATIGSKDWNFEKKALEAVETAYDKLDAERNKGPRANPATVERLSNIVKGEIEKANKYVDPNAYIRVIEENGAVGFNASTGMDFTNYYYSLPSNRTELWFLLQSSWFKRPVFREFYKERDVVRDERRMRVESNPQGKLQEMLLATAFTAHPYRNLVGWASDIENLRASDAEEFFKKHYVAANITVAIAGDITAADAKRLAQKYFAPLPTEPMPGHIGTVEPKQDGEKRVAVESPAQPMLFIAYKRPSDHDKDDPVFDVLSSILSSGRTGILYKELVRDKQIALGAATVATLPAGRHPNLFAFISAPSSGHTVEESEKAWYEIIDRLKKEPVDKETLERVKTKLRAGLIRGLDSNSGLASELAQYYAAYGDWRKLFTGINEIDKVTAEDVQRVAKQYFESSGRTVAYSVKGAAQ